MKHIPPSAEVLAATASSAFSNPAFEHAVVETTSQILREWASTQMGESEKREKLWMKHHALEDVVNMMAGYIAVKQDTDDTGGLFGGDTA